MDKLLQSLINMNDLDDTAVKDSWIHRLHPLFKMISCFLLIVFVLTSNQIKELLVYLIILFVVIKLAKLSIKKGIKRGLLGLPFCICFGISYLFTSSQWVNFYGMMIPQGMVLCLLLFFKTFLCLISVYLLISTTSFEVISSELVHIKVPSIFVLQLTMTYRYIFMLLSEAKIMAQSYLLKSPRSKAIEWKDIGSFIGHLLIKSMKQSQYVYDCMKCRGFDVSVTYTDYIPFDLENLFLLMIVFSVMILIKVVC